MALKGLGGFLLLCDATNKKAVKVLRQRKKREFKPLAIMVADIEESQEPLPGIRCRGKATQITAKSNCVIAMETGFHGK